MYFTPHNHAVACMHAPTYEVLHIRTYSVLFTNSVCHMVHTYNTPTFTVSLTHAYPHTDWMTGCDAHQMVKGKSQLHY